MLVAVVGSAGGKTLVTTYIGVAMPRFQSYLKAPATGVGMCDRQLTGPHVRAGARVAKPPCAGGACSAMLTVRAPAAMATFRLSLQRSQEWPPVMLAGQGSCSRCDYLTLLF